jgi:hypothetical protein
MDVKPSPRPFHLPQTRYPEREKIARRIWTEEKLDSEKWKVCSEKWKMDSEKLDMRKKEVSLSE